MYPFLAIAANALDAAVTILGVQTHGIAAESNPIVAYAMGTFGIYFGAFGVKALALPWMLLSPRILMACGTIGAASWLFS